VGGIERQEIIKKDKRVLKMDGRTKKVDDEKQIGGEREREEGENPGGG